MRGTSGFEFYIGRRGIGFQKVAFLFCFFIGANDIPHCQSEVNKSNIAQVCKLAMVMSDAVICSGNIIVAEMLDAQLFIDKWRSPEDKAGMLRQENMHPIQEGGALISCRIA